MRVLLVVGLVPVILAGCASNKAADEPGTRVRGDTTLTAKIDTTHPSDTLPHIRDTVPDSTSR
jgi:outer membrane murein-binding lipoprotein Lpp